jgi:hypothetical protein
MRVVPIWFTALFLSAGALAVAAPAIADLTAGAARARESMVIVSSHLGNHRDAIGAGVVVALEPRRIRWSPRVTW